MDYSQEGDKRLERNEFDNAVDFYTKGIELKCKDDDLNAAMYTKRARVHFYLGKSKFTYSCEMMIYFWF